MNNTEKKIFLTRLLYGIKAIWREKWKGFFVLLLIPIIFGICYVHNLLLGFGEGLPIYEVYKCAVHIVLGIFFTLICVYMFLLLGTPISSKTVQGRLERVGFTNSANETPILLAKYRDKNRFRITIYEFENRGIPIKVWEEKQSKLETVLNLRIVKIVQGKSFKRTILYTAPSRRRLPQKIYWNDGLLEKENFVLVLGENLYGKETVNLLHTPHILLGGSTGSGKTLLLKSLLMQCVKKGAKVYIADFKGGIDFPHIWHDICTLITNKQALLELLEQAEIIMEQRKELFRKLECSNIEEYNKLSNSKMQRIIIGFDEITSILEKTGLTKEDKELTNQIEGKLSLLARTARASGLTIIVATQRPSADILSGQIRNNIDFRICGKADSILSNIILDNSSAAERIPKDSHGQFITNTGVMFQGYLFDEKSCFD